MDDVLKFLGHNWDKYYHSIYGTLIMIRGWDKFSVPKDGTTVVTQLRDKYSVPTILGRKQFTQVWDKSAVTRSQWKKVMSQAFNICWDCY